jgi:hypothetical protein
VTALARDMQGAQSRVLANRDWGELSMASLTDTSDQVATAFARYPYPESFFSWGDNKQQDVVFFNRANRYPRGCRNRRTASLPRRRRSQSRGRGCAAASD